MDRYDKALPSEETNMPLEKEQVLAKARSHFEFFAEARDEQTLFRLFNGAVGYCQAVWKTGLISEEELTQLLTEAEQLRANWYSAREN